MYFSFAFSRFEINITFSAKSITTSSNICVIVDKLITSDVSYRFAKAIKGLKINRSTNSCLYWEKKLIGTGITNDKAIITAVITVEFFGKIILFINSIWLYIKLKRNRRI